MGWTSDRKDLQLDKFMVMSDSRFRNGTPVATDTDPSGGFFPQNISDRRPGKKHKFNGPGLKSYQVDCGEDKAADTLYLRRHNYGSAQAKVTPLYADNIILDNFDDGSIDSAKWGTDVDDGGVPPPEATSIIETTVLTIQAAGVASGAMIYDKDILPPRYNKAWNIRINNKCTPDAIREMTPIFLWQGAAAPALATTTPAMGRLGFMTQKDNGNIRFLYYDTGGSIHSWDGAAWQSGGAQVAYAGTVTTEYIFEMSSDKTSLYFMVYSAEGVLLESASIPWSDIRAESNDMYCLWGDPDTSFLAGEIITTNYERYEWAETETPDQTIEDSFDNASLDPVKFGSSIDVGSGAASVVETTNLRIDTSGDDSAAAMVYDKDPLPDTPWDIRHTCSCNPVNSVTPLWLTDKASAPTVASLGNKIASFSQTSSGNIRFSYINADSVAMFWDGSEWLAVSSVAYSGTISTKYIWEFASDGKFLYFLLYDKAGTLLQTASIPWSDVLSISDDLYALWGDPLTSLWLGVTISTRYERNDYPLYLPFVVPRDNFQVLAFFTSRSARYWKVQVMTPTEAAWIGVMELGERLEFPKQPSITFDPSEEGIRAKGNQSGTGEPLGSSIDYKTRRIRAKWNQLDRGFVMRQFKPLYDAEISELNPVIVSWDDEDEYNEPVFGTISGSFKFRTPLKVKENITVFAFDVAGVKERYLDNV